MDSYKYTIEEIANKLGVNQIIELKNGTKLKVSSKPFLSPTKIFFFKCEKNAKETTYSLNYIYDNDLVISDTLGLFKKEVITFRYKNRCWKCGKAIDSDICERCDICGWYICIYCGCCKNYRNMRIKNICL